MLLLPFEFWRRIINRRDHDFVVHVLKIFLTQGEETEDIIRQHFEFCNPS
jgi:hypothetical protein